MQVGAGEYQELKGASGRRRIPGVEGCKWAQENTGRKAQEYNAVGERGAKEKRTLETQGRKKTKGRVQENEISRGNRGNRGQPNARAQENNRQAKERGASVRKRTPGEQKAVECCRMKSGRYYDRAGARVGLQGGSQ